MFAKRPFARFNIPFSVYGGKIGKPQGDLSLSAVKVMYTAGDGCGPCLRCGTAHEYGYKLYLEGQDIVSCGVSFPFTISGYFCPSCVTEIVKIMGVTF
jgi:hypothetical protein